MIAILLLLIVSVLTTGFDKERSRPSRPSRPSPSDEQQQPSSACTDAACTVVESVHIEDACIDNLLVAGDPVTGEDGNPCTYSERDADSGLVVSTLLENCCKSDGDCAKFSPLPSSCFQSTCKNKVNGVGRCQHVNKHNCCTCDEDCPQKACKTAKCVCRPDGQNILSKDFEFVTQARGTQDKQCVYTDIENCCLDSVVPPDNPTYPFACPNMAVCATHETAVCDKAMHCICIKEIEHDCDTDADCNQPRNNTMAAAVSSDNGSDGDGEESRRSRRSGGSRRPPKSADRCANLICSPSHLCVPDKHNQFDGDKDGVPCRHDCDDNNATVSTYVYCAREGTDKDPQKYNRDNDTCIKCGAPVDKFCANECPATVGAALGTNSTVKYFKVNATSVTEEGGHLKLTYDCDCCDDNPAGCDVPGFCGINADHDHWALCPVEPACLLVLPRKGDDETSPYSSRKDDDDEEDDKSQLSGDEDSIERSWRNDRRRSLPPRGGRGGKYSDHDDDGDDSHAQECTAVVVTDTRCQDWATQQGKDDPQNWIVVEPHKVDECEDCEEDACRREKSDKVCHYDPDHDNSGFCPGATSLYECCIFINSQNPVTAPKEVRDCCNNLSGDGLTCDGMPPILIDQCVCPPGYDDDVDDSVDQCPQEEGTYRHTCYPDRDGDGAADCSMPKPICSDKENAAEACKKAGMIFIPNVGYPKRNKYCDCDDTKEALQQWVACVPDEDGDGAVDCKHCDLYCGRCPHGTKHVEQKEMDGNSHNYGGDKEASVRKRSLANTKNLLDVVLKRSPIGGAEWNDNSGDDNYSNDDEDDDKSRPSKPSRPQHPLKDHEECPKYANEQTIGYPCDCCDKDKYAFPGSNYTSENPIKCATQPGYWSHDYNCNKVKEYFGACDTHPLAKKDGRYIRQDTDLAVFPITTSPPASWLGKCDQPSQNTTCGRRFGPVFDNQPNVLFVSVKKRSITVEAPTECQNSDVTTIPADKADDLIFPMLPGQCGEFITACLLNTKPATDTCTGSCDICVVTGQ